MFTDEELSVISQIIRNVPITGTLDTLPIQLAKLAEILRKIDVELRTRSETEQYLASHSS
jgi:hypothetical protein